MRIILLFIAVLGASAVLLFVGEKGGKIGLLDTLPAAGALLGLILAVLVYRSVKDNIREIFGSVEHVKNLSDMLSKNVLKIKEQSSEMSS